MVGPIMVKYYITIHIHKSSQFYYPMITEVRILNIEIYNGHINIMLKITY